MGGWKEGRMDGWMDECVRGCCLMGRLVASGKEAQQVDNSSSYPPCLPPKVGKSVQW